MFLNNKSLGSNFMRVNQRTSMMLLFTTYGKELEEEKEVYN